MTVARPPQYLDWTDGNPSKVVQPPANFLLEGWDPGQAPPSQYMNWLFYTTDQWIQYLDHITNAGIPDQVLRLINGGYWSFDKTTGNLAWSLAFNISVPGSPDSANQVAAGAAAMADGDVAYVDIGLPVVANGTIQNGSNHILSMNYTGNLFAGMNVIGAGIPSGTTVVSVSPTSVQISQNATADTVGVTLLFSSVNTPVVLTSPIGSFIPTLSSIVIARRVGAKVFVGINSSEMVLLDGEFKQLCETGYLQTFEDVLAGESLLAGEAIYISPGGSADGFRTAGCAYKLDCSPGNGIRSAYAGFVATNVSTGLPATIAFGGFIKASGLTPGVIYYGDPAVAGGIVNPKPSIAGASIQPVGIALSATKLLLTNAEGIVGPQNQSIFVEDDLGVGNGSTLNFTLSESPLDQNSTFVFLDGLVVPKNQWSLSGTTVTFVAAPAVGVSVEAQYIQANQLTISAKQEIPTAIDAGITFQLSGLPINQSSLMLFIDGEKISQAEYNLVLMANSAQIVLNTALAPGQDIYVTYFQNVAGSGGFGSVTGGANLGSGQALFSAVVAGVMKFLSIKAGANVTITPDGLGSLVISSTGGGGGGGGYTRQVYGTPGSPDTFNPASGLAPGSENDQTWILQTSGGAQVVSASLQILPGSIIGQRLTLRGVDSVNYYILNGVSGAVVRGLSLNGDCYLMDDQCLLLEWDGVVWYEITRRL